MNLVQKVIAMREGGKTIRAHTQQYIGPYNVAIHSYNALSLLLLLYPGQPSYQLIRAVLWHDVPERWTGDVPAPAKWASPELKSILAVLENQILEKLEIADLFKLTEQEANWLWAVDILELYLWGKEQAALGNTTIEPVLRRIAALLADKAERLPKQVLDFIPQYAFGEAFELL